MKATLISPTATLLEELRRSVEAEGHEIVQVLARKTGQSLAELLIGIEDGLLIVDSAGAELNNDLAALGALTAMHPSLGIILLSSKRDAEALIAAMRVGVREVLESPPNSLDLTAALRHVSSRTRPMAAVARRGRIIGFGSGKPGSGATTLCTNLAYLLASEHNKKTLLIDLDFDYGDTSFFMGEGPSSVNVVTIAQQAARLDAKLLARSALALAPNLSLLAAPMSLEEALGITPDQLGRVLDVACEAYDFVLIDIQRTVEPTVAIKAIDRTEFIFLVLENMIPHVRDAKRLVNILYQLGCPRSKLRLIVNRYDKHSAISLEQIEKALNVKVSYTIANSFAEVSESINTGVPLGKVNPRNPVVRGLRVIADELAGKTTSSEHTWLGRLVGEQS